MNYCEVFPKVYENLKSQLDIDLKDYKDNGFPKNIVSVFTFMSSDLETLAIGEYILNKDVALMKNYLYNAALAHMRAMQYFDTHSDINPAGFVSMLSFRQLFYAIISDSHELAIKFANLLGGRGKVDMQDTDKHTVNLGYALKYIVLDEYARASEYVNKLNNTKIAHHADLLRAIIEKNESNVNASLKEILKNHKSNKSTKGTPHELFSIITVALAKLAIMKGFSVDIDDSIAPKEVITHTDVEYKLVDIMKLNYE